MIYGYARVSTKGQARDGNSLSDQKEKLKAAGAEKIFVDSFTGTKLDRIARSANQGSSFVQEMIARGVRVHVLNMGMMDNTPTGKLIMNVMFAFAEFERDMIVQRTQEGKEIARQKKDYHEGRPRLSIDYEVLEKFREKQKGGELTIEQCCKRLGISRTSWYNYTRK